MKNELVKRFMERFRGLDRAYGRYALSGKKSPKGKVEGQASTVKEPVPESAGKDHLAGKIGLGKVPVNDEGLSWFGAIDFDEYGLNLNLLEKKVRDLGLPLIVCRTKSGGAHLYLFLKEPAEAEFVRSVLREWSILLGCPKAEIFPKQDRIESEEDCGSWINLPYFGGDNTTRYAIMDGKNLSAEKFLNLADQLATTKGEVEKLKVSEGDFSDGPPCLQALAKEGFPEGTRNLGLYNIGIYCKMKDEGALEENLEEFNRRHMAPPLSSKDVMTILKSVKKKDYFYKCKDQPISNVCNRVVCMGREFGVGSGSSRKLKTLITKIEFQNSERPKWFVTVKGHRIQFDSSDDLLDQRRFAKRCWESPAHFLPDDVKREDWKKMWNDLRENIVEIFVPPEAEAGGEFKIMLEQYCTERAKALGEEGLLSKKAYEKNGVTLFQLTDVVEWIRKKKTTISISDAISHLRSMGAEPIKSPIRIKGKQVRVWRISSNKFTEVTEKLMVPEVPGGDREAEF